jgi:protein SCO1/2
MKRKLTVAAAVACTAALAVGLWAALADRHGAAASPATGIRLDRVLRAVPLLDEHGRTITLADFRGKVLVLSPTLTLCHEVCPLTAGAFTVMRQAVRRAGLGDRVVFAEISVDPWRDSPARLRGFARYAGIGFRLLTGTERNLRRFWRQLGVGFFKTPQGAPPDVDWWTHRPETFDVAHTDGLFFVDGRGHLRIAVVGMPAMGGRLASRLRRLLSDKGLANLRHPEAPWTIPQALANLSDLLGRPIPPGRQTR